jgi:hypothetical protein
MRGEFGRRHEVDAVLEKAGDAAVVVRGRDRSIVLACPDGCGDLLTVNLDPQAGPAWRIYRRDRGLSVFPSVWRESDCRSHFIIWQSNILWCDLHEAGNRAPAKHEGLGDAVSNVLDFEFRSPVEIAEVLGEVPWDVARACRELADAGKAEEGKGNSRGCYRRTMYTDRAAPP